MIGRGALRTIGLTGLIGLLAIACACAAVAGHNWPIYLRFKGGKGVATSAGVLIGIAPLAVVIGIITWILLVLTTRYVSIASLAAAGIIAASGWFIYAKSGIAVPVFLTFLAALIIWRHRANIQRLIKGNENRFEFKKKK